MDLADRIINGVGGAQDELGVYLPPDPDNPPPEYMAQRILVRNPHLYTENGKIYIDRTEIKETAENLVGLANLYNRLAVGPRHRLVWNKLREMAPVYDPDYIWVSPELVWNMKTCELEKQEPKENHI